MLNERDRRTLNEIELHLAGEDPWLASVMQLPTRSERWLRRGYDATIVLASVLALTCLFLSGVGGAGAGVVAAILALAMFGLRRRRFSSARATASGPGDRPGLDPPGRDRGSDPDHR